MLKVSADVSAVNTKRIITIGTGDMVSLTQWLTEVTTHEVLVPKLCSKGCATGFPVEVGTKTNTVDISTIIVVLHLLGFTTIALVAIAVLIPVDAWSKVQSSALCLTLDGTVELGGVLILVVGLPFRSGVESAASPTFIGYAKVPVQSDIIVVILSLIEALGSTVVGIQRSGLTSRVTIATRVVGREAVVGLTAKSHASAHISIPKGPRFAMQSNVS